MIPEAQVSYPPPPKWTHIERKGNIWSDTVESTKKDVERFFGILKRYGAAVSILLSFKIQIILDVFTAYAILHSIILDYDGIDNWENRRKKTKFNDNDDTIYLNSVSINQSKLMDDILYNEEGMNCPASDSTDVHLDFRSNEQTDHEMTFRLRT
jgi:hypothetical protein